MLLGVKAVIAESYERIHRSNLVAMGVLPLQFLQGQSRETLSLDGTEEYDMRGLADGLNPGHELTVRVHSKGGDEREFRATVRIDSGVEVDYFRHGGVLQMVLRRMLG
jgi:aconitate hydratase